MPCACFSVYVYMCVRVCVCLLNVFLYKIGSSGSSTSRRTTLALRMKPDLQKYVARVFRVFGTFSPLSCPPLPHSSHLISLSLSTISANPHSLTLVATFSLLSSPITRSSTPFILSLSFSLVFPPPLNTQHSKTVSKQFQESKSIGQDPLPREFGEGKIDATSSRNPPP